MFIVSFSRSLGEARTPLDEEKTVKYATYDGMAPLNRLLGPFWPPPTVGVSGKQRKK